MSVIVELLGFMFMCLILVLLGTIFLMNLCRIYADIVNYGVTTLSCYAVTVLTRGQLVAGIKDYDVASFGSTPLESLPDG